MNILMMSKIFAKSGVGSHMRDLSGQLTKMGHTVHIMSSTNDWGDFCERSGINFFRVDFNLLPLPMIKNLIYIYIL